jgi:hypothetical protein
MYLVTIKIVGGELFLNLNIVLDFFMFLLAPRLFNLSPHAFFFEKFILGSDPMEIINANTKQLDIKTSRVTTQATTQVLDP